MGNTYSYLSGEESIVVVNEQNIEKTTLDQPDIDIVNKSETESGIYLDEVESITEEEEETDKDTRLREVARLFLDNIICDVIKDLEIKDNFNKVLYEMKNNDFSIKDNLSNTDFDSEVSDYFEDEELNSSIKYEVENELTINNKKVKKLQNENLILRDEFDELFLNHTRLRIKYDELKVKYEQLKKKII